MSQLPGGVQPNRLLGGRSSSPCRAELGPKFPEGGDSGARICGAPRSFLPHLSGCPLHLCPASSDSQTGVRSSRRHEPLLGLIFKTLFTSKPLSEMWFCPGEGVAVAFRTDVTPFPGWRPRPDWGGGLGLLTDLLQMERSGPLQWRIKV